MLIVDAHLDLAYSALKYGRDLRRPLAQIRSSESPDKARGTATVAFPEMREAGIVLAFGTIFVEPRNSALALGGDEGFTYASAEQAHKLGMQQLDYYRRLADDPASRIQMVGDSAGLDAVLAAQNSATPLIGIVPLMEGADPIRQPEEVEMWVEKGLRLIGLAWDDTRYAAGAWRGTGVGISAEGRRLLELMEEYRLILDLSHMSERATFDAFEQFGGRVVATHCNARQLVPGERQLSDTQIQLIGERDGVIGIVLFNPFLQAGVRAGDPRETVTVEHAISHIDHICQLLGSAAHVGIGSDFDGGFGRENIPAELNSIADLPQIATRLQRYGYSDGDIAGIMGTNWQRLLRATWQ